MIIQRQNPRQRRMPWFPRSSRARPLWASLLPRSKLLSQQHQMTLSASTTTTEKKTLITLVSLLEFFQRRKHCPHHKRTQRGLLQQLDTRLRSSQTLRTPLPRSTSRTPSSALLLRHILSRRRTGLHSQVHHILARSRRSRFSLWRHR